MKCKPLIISIKGIKLSPRERFLLTKEKPWGIILFKRNLESLKQIIRLTSLIKKITKNNHFPILIDEEGETVSRLQSLINHNLNASFFGSLYKKDKTFCSNIYKHYIESLCKVLKMLGININTISVLDILRLNTSKIIGKRSFSKNKNIVKELGQLTIKYLHQNKIAGIIKHIPGHGAAASDSHLNTPRVKLSKKELNGTDFYPFKSSNAKFAMTAHILYTKLDNKNVATLSSKIIKDKIRKKIRFNGILISDDISMKALKYNLVVNAKKSLEAGCNLVLYCAGNTNDNFKLIRSLPYVDRFTSQKTSEFFKFLR